MSLKKTLFKETLLYSIGSFGSKILSFLLVFFYSYFLSKQELGEYDLFITMVMFFVPIALLQISDSAYRWLIESEDKQTKKKIITSSFLIVLVSNFVLNLVLYCLFQFKEVPYSEYFGAFLFCNSLLLFFQSILRGLKKIKLYSIYGALSSFLLVLLNVIFLYFFDYGVKGVIIAGIVSNFLIILLIIINVKLYQYFSFSAFKLELSKKMLHYALPLIPNILSWWLISSASKFIITDQMGMESNGIYAISNRLPSILVVLNSVLILPIQDFYLKKDGDEATFFKIINLFMYLELLLAFILSIGAPVYLKLIVSTEYYEAWKYTAPLYFGVAFNSLAALIGLVYQKIKKTIWITITSFIGGVVSIIISFVLIDYIGLLGISLSFFIGYFLLFIIRFVNLIRKYNVNINVLNLTIILIVLLPLIFISYNMNFDNQVLFFIFILVLFLVFLIIYREKFKRLIKF